MCGTLGKESLPHSGMEGAAANRRAAGTHAASMGLTAGSAPTRPPRPRCRTRAARRAARPPRRATRCGTRPPAARWSRPGRRGARVSARRRRAWPGVLARGGARAGRCAQPTGTTASPSCAWPSPHTCTAAPRPRGLPLVQAPHCAALPRARLGVAGERRARQRAPRRRLVGPDRAARHAHVAHALAGEEGACANTGRGPPLGHGLARGAGSRAHRATACRPTAARRLRPRPWVCSARALPHTARATAREAHRSCRARARPAAGAAACRASPARARWRAARRAPPRASQSRAGRRGRRAPASRPRSGRPGPPGAGVRAPRRIGCIGAGTAAGAPAGARLLRAALAPRRVHGRLDPAQVPPAAAARRRVTSLAGAAACAARPRGRAPVARVAGAAGRPKVAREERAADVEPVAALDGRHVHAPAPALRGCPRVGPSAPCSERAAVHRPLTLRAVAMAASLSPNGRS